MIIFSLWKTRMFYLLPIIVISCGSNALVVKEKSIAPKEEIKKKITQQRETPPPKDADPFKKWQLDVKQAFEELLFLEDRIELSEREYQDFMQWAKKNKREREEVDSALLYLYILDRDDN